MAKIFSIEDGNLDTSIRVSRDKQYSDFDLVFKSKTSSDGDIFKKTDAASVKQSVKTLLLTNRFEKPYRPLFGADLQSLLFSLADDELGSEISESVKSAIERYEPRAVIQRIEVSSTPDYNTVIVTIEFRVINTQLIDTLSLRVTEQSSGTSLSEFVVPVTVEYIPEKVILTESSSRLMTEFGVFLSRDIGKTTDNAILTQDGDEISLSNSPFDVIIKT